MDRRLLDRWIGERAARAVGWAVVVVGSVLLLSGVVVDQLVAAADKAFAVRNGDTQRRLGAADRHRAIGRAGLARRLGVAGP